MGQTSWEVSSLDLGSGWLGDDLRTVDHSVNIVAEDGELLEGRLESSLELVLVADEGLPLASSTRVTGEVVVGLETDLAFQGRLDFTLVTSGSILKEKNEHSAVEVQRTAYPGKRVPRS